MISIRYNILVIVNITKRQEEKEFPLATTFSLAYKNIFQLLAKILKNTSYIVMKPCKMI